MATSAAWNKYFHPSPQDTFCTHRNTPAYPNSFLFLRRQTARCLPGICRTRCRSWRRPIWGCWTGLEATGLRFGWLHLGFRLPGPARRLAPCSGTYLEECPSCCRILCAVLWPTIWDFRARFQSILWGWRCFDLFLLSATHSRLWPIPSWTLAVSIRPFPRLQSLCFTSRLMHWSFPVLCYYIAEALRYQK